MPEENASSDDRRLPADSEDVGSVDCADYCGPEDGHGVVDHGSDGGACDDGDVADIFEEAGWDEGGVLDEVCFLGFVSDDELGI